MSGKKMLSDKGRSYELQLDSLNGYGYKLRKWKEKL